jgi:hypothetical protein
LLGEHRHVEAGVTFRGGDHQLVIAEPAKRADRVDVEVVAWLAPAVQRTHLVADRIGQAQHRTDIKHHGVVVAPVHAQVDVQLNPVTGGHVQPREPCGTPGLLDLVATPPQLVGHLVDRDAERGHVLAGGEQVDVLGRPIDHAVLTDRTEPAKAKPSTPARATWRPHAAQRPRGPAPGLPGSYRQRWTTHMRCLMGGDLD